MSYTQYKKCRFVSDFVDYLGYIIKPRRLKIYQWHKKDSWTPIHWLIDKHYVLSFVCSMYAVTSFRILQISHSWSTNYLLRSTGAVQTKRRTAQVIEKIYQQDLFTARSRLTATKRSVLSRYRRFCVWYRIHIAPDAWRWKSQTHRVLISIIKQCGTQLFGTRAQILRRHLDIQIVTSVLKIPNNHHIHRLSWPQVAF